MYMCFQSVCLQILNKKPSTDYMCILNQSNVCVYTCICTVCVRMFIVMLYVCIINFLAKDTLTWFKEYVGTFYANPRMEPSEIPNHSAFFLLSVDNR